MKSIKAYMPVLLLGLIAIVPGTLAAQNTQSSFGGAITNFGNPCDGSVVVGSGTNTVYYHENDSHAAVHLRYDGNGPVYTTSFEANGAFDSAPMIFNYNGTVYKGYQLTFHSVWVARGDAPTFHIDGTVWVYLESDTNIAVGSGISSATLTCAN